MYRCYLEPFFGRMRLDEITASTVTRLSDRNAQTWRIGGPVQQGSRPTEGMLAVALPHWGFPIRHKLLVRQGGATG